MRDFTQQPSDAKARWVLDGAGNVVKKGSRIRRGLHDEAVVSQIERNGMVTIAVVGVPFRRGSARMTPERFASSGWREESSHMSFRIAPAFASARARPHGPPKRVGGIDGS